MTTLDRGHFSRRQDEAHLWRTDALGGLELLRAHYVEFSFPPHIHEEFMIAVTEGGVGLPRFRGVEHGVGPGAVIVLNPGEVHGGGPAGNRSWRYRAFYPRAELMTRVRRELTGADGGTLCFSEDVVTDPYVATLLHRAHRALEDARSALEGETRLLDALAGLIERHGVERALPHRIGHEHRAVKLAKEYLHSLPQENVLLERLAQAAGLSAFHLTRVFRKETGLSAHAYQILIRARFAKGLLAKGLPISQVAVDAGFFDQAHFTRHFKRIFGVTPGCYLSTRFPSAPGSGGSELVVSQP